MWKTSDLSGFVCHLSLPHTLRDRPFLRHVGGYLTFHPFSWEVDSEKAILRNFRPHRTVIPKLSRQITPPPPKLNY